jgi:hypothetical protein
MSGNIPYAQPYPWADETMVARQKIVTQALRKRKFVGTGLALLQKEALGPKSKMSPTAQNILVNLFHQHGMELSNEVLSESALKDNNNTTGQSKRPKIILQISKKRGVPEPGTPDEEIVKKASEGKYSLFKTILSVIENEKTLDAVPTPLMLAKVCFVVPPSAIPGSMDAKDMVLAALQFLSSTYEAKSKEMMELPIIKAVQRYSDLEKRYYQKEGTWQLEDFDKDGRLLKLEDFFLLSPSSWKWLRREVFCPRLTKAEEATFFLNGTVPEGATGKAKQPPRKKKATPTKKPTAATKKEAPSPTASSFAHSETPSFAPSFDAADASIAEASVAASSDSEGDDDFPVVEAQILDDDSSEDEDESLAAVEAIP